MADNFALYYEIINAGKNNCRDILLFNTFPHIQVKYKLACNKEIGMKPDQLCIKKDSV